MLKKVARTALITLGVISLLVFASSFLPGEAPPRRLRFDKFVSAVKENRVKKVTIKDRSHVVIGTYASGSEFETKMPGSFDTPQLLLEYEIPTSVDSETGLDWLNVVLSFVPIIILAYYMRKMSMSISELDRKTPGAD